MLDVGYIESLIAPALPFRRGRGDGRLIEARTKNSIMKRSFSLIVAAMVAMLVNAVAPNDFGTYYQNANGKKGSALKTALCGIIYNRTEKSYDYLWTAFRTTDKRDGKVWDMYSDMTNYEFGGPAQGANYSKEGDSYNREHSFPKSWFGGEVMPMYTDLHHMYPTDGFVNNKRGNYPFGKTNGNSYKSHNSFSKLGSCTYPGYTGTVFEPADEYKGDFARTYFYMVTCYEEKLADWYSKNSESRATIDGSTYPGFQTWQLNMLLEWAAADQVSDKETARNNAVAGIQGNRNPFIDYPGLEQYIWGSKKDDTFSYDNYVLPTEYAGYNSGSGSGGQGGETGEGECDVIDLAFTGMSGTNYSSWSGKKGSVSSAVYAGQSAGGNNSVQLRSSNSNSGIVTTTSGGKVTKVVVTWNSNTETGRTLNVYGKNTAYSAVTDLYDSSKQGTLLGTIVKGTSTELTITGNYTFVGLRSNSGAMYLDKIEITWVNDPSFNGLADVSVDWGSALTLTKGTTGTPNIVTNGDVTLSSLNEYVVTVDGLTIKPVAVGTTVIIVNTSATTTYNAGSVMFPITVNAPEGKGTAPSIGNEIVFEETFAKCNGEGGNDGKWNGSINGGLLQTDNSNWSISNGNGANQCVKLGTASKKGSATTPSIGSAGTLILTFRAGAWNTNSEGTTLKLSVSAGSINPSSVTLTKAAFNTYTATITNATAATKITFEAENTSNNRFFLDDVIVTTPEIPAPAISVTLNRQGYATYCSEYPLDFSDNETADYSAWQVTGVNGTAITFAQITGSIKGGQGILLKGEAGATIALTSVDSENVLNGNLLEGTLVPWFVETDQYYGLSGKKFVKVKPGTVSAGKALLPASILGGNDIKAYTFEFEDEATAIKTIDNGQLTTDGVIYNLAGQRMGKMQKGINIVNGKKILF